ncbi:MAG: hypothetical protein FWG75_00795 [Cystobacterineae bacterium]|nr:hypothetical protein [Cystobacterineae bacterium]
MSTYKKKQKELRSPDAFQKAGQEAIPWLVHNQVRLFIGALLLVIGGAGVALWVYLGQRAELQEAEAFSMALEPFIPPLVPVEGQAAKTPAELNAELLNSLKAFEAQSQGKTPAARNAHLLLAYVHLQLGQAEEALAAAERFLANLPPGNRNPLRLSALEAKGYALEQSKQYALAFEAFGELEQSHGQEELKGKGEYHQARMLLLQGQTTEALALFEKVSALEASKSEVVMLAKQRAKALLESKLMTTKPSANDEANNEAKNEAKNEADLETKSEAKSEAS